LLLIAGANERELRSRLIDHCKRKSADGHACERWAQTFRLRAARPERRVAAGAPRGRRSS